MTYTRHGQPIPGSTENNEPPSNSLGCGGVNAFCPECLEDVAEYRKLMGLRPPLLSEQIKGWDPVKKAKALAASQINMDSKTPEDVVTVEEMSLLWFSDHSRGWEAVLVGPRRTDREKVR